MERAILGIQSVVVVLCLTSVASATILTFDTGQGNNADLPTTFGSNISGNIAGANVNNGGTPNIALAWAPSPNVLEVHGGIGFAPVGDGKVLQLDLNGGEADPTLTFDVAAGYRLRINSLVIGHATDMTEPANAWTISISEDGGPEVFSHTTAAMGAGDTETVMIKFLGEADTDYVLKFDDGGADHVRAAIDNLSFNQVEGVALIFNGGNDEPLVGSEIPGWDEIVGTTWTQRSATPSPQAGAHYFMPGAGPNHELAQTVDVSAYASTIDAGIQRFDFSGYVSGWRDPGDTSRIIVEYENATGVVLDSWDSGAIYNPYDEAPTWQQLTHSQFAPAGARQIQIRLIAVRNAGTNNDGYFDSITLSTQVEADNTTLLMFDTGQGNNADLATTFGSNLSGEIAGALVLGGGTPDIGLTWAPSPNVLEIHGGIGFAPVGDGKVLQFDLNGGEADPTITFAVAAGYRLRINSLRIGHASDMTEPDNAWTVTISENGGPQVFSHTTAAMGASDTELVTFNFIGEVGTDYVLKFDDGGANHVRAAIDNLSFSQLEADNTTVLTFETGQSNNDALPSSYGSNISGDTTAIRAMGGGTPNIALTWSSIWDAHGKGPGSTFDTVDPVNHTTTTDVGQMDTATGANVTFRVDAGHRLELNSLLIGHASDQSKPAFSWDITITEDGGPEVFSHTTANLNGAGSPATETVTFSFKGDFGVDYVLSFESNGGPHPGSQPTVGAIDDLCFSQAEPQGTLFRFR